MMKKLVVICALLWSLPSMAFQEGEVITSQFPTTWCQTPDPIHKSVEVLEETGSLVAAYNILLENCAEVPAGISFKINKVLEGFWLQHPRMNNNKKTYYEVLEIKGPSGRKFYSAQADLRSTGI